MIKSAKQKLLINLSLLNEVEEIELYCDSLLVHAISAYKNKSLKSDNENILIIFDILNVILNEILMSILVRDIISKETAHRFYGMNSYEKLIFSTKENRFIPSDAMPAAATLPWPLRPTLHTKKRDEQGKTNVTKRESQKRSARSAHEK